MNFYVFPVLKETNTKIYFGSLTTNQQLEKKYNSILVIFKQISNITYLR